MNKVVRAKYLEELGIPEYLYEHRVVSSTTKPNKKIVKCLVVECTDNNSFCIDGNSKNLLTKMLSAIGLVNKDFECVNIINSSLENELNKYEAESVLLMSDKLKANKDNQFTTHHPSKIYGNEKLKRNSWEVLKNLKKCLK